MKTAVANDKDVELALKGVRIPSCPDILMQLMTELRDPGVSGKQISTLIGRDVGLAAAVVLPGREAIGRGSERRHWRLLRDIGRH